MKDEIYLESKAMSLHGEDIVAIEDAKTYGKVVELEKNIEYLHLYLQEYQSTEAVIQIQKLESEIDKLMGL